MLLKAAAVGCGSTVLRLLLWGVAALCYGCCCGVWQHCVAAAAVGCGSTATAGAVGYGSTVLRLLLWGVAAVSSYVMVTSAMM